MIRSADHDELARKDEIAEELTLTVSGCESPTPTYANASNVLQAAIDRIVGWESVYRKPRTITATMQLDLLPTGSVVLDDDQVAFQRADEYDSENETHSLWTRDSHLLHPPSHIALPAVVLWEPA